MEILGHVQNNVCRGKLHTLTHTLTYVIVQYIAHMHKHLYKYTQSTLHVGYFVCGNCLWHVNCYMQNVFHMADNYKNIFL